MPFLPPNQAPKVLKKIANTYSASEVTTIWRYRNSIIIIIITNQIRFITLLVKTKKNAFLAKTGETFLSVAKKIV